MAKKMKIPFQQFAREYEEIKTEVLATCEKFFSSGYYILGPNTAEFESTCVKKFGFAAAAGVANGTDAITLAIKALNIPEGSEIITTPITAYGTVLGIVRAGCIPTLVDINTDTGLIDINKLKATRKTRAIIPVHLYGQMVDMASLMSFAKEHQLLVVEDCAQALGAKQNNIFAGTIGDAAAFSFYPTKNLGAYGDGGMVVTRKSAATESVKSMRNYGQKTRYEHSIWGLNSRLDELQASMLNLKLKYLNHWIERRQKIATYYQQNLKTVSPLNVLKNNLHTYHLFVVKTDRRDKLMDTLGERGISSIIHYPIPIHKQPVFTYGTYALPKAEEFVTQILSLPIYAQLTDTEVESVVKTCNSM